MGEGRAVVPMIPRCARDKLRENYASLSAFSRRSSKPFFNSFCSFLPVCGANSRPTAAPAATPTANVKKNLPNFALPSFTFCLAHPVR